MRIAALFVLACGCASSGGGSTDANQAYHDSQEALQKGDYARAIERAEVAMKGAPSAAGPYVLRAKAHQGLGKLTDAERDFTTAIDKASADGKPIYHFWRGLFYSDTGRHEKALADFDIACEGQTRKPVLEYYIECFYERARSCLALGRKAEALKDIDHILGKNPDPETRGKFEALRAQAVK